MTEQSAVQNAIVDIYSDSEVLLQVRDLDVRFYSEEGELRAVQGPPFLSAKAEH